MKKIDCTLFILFLGLAQPAIAGGDASAGKASYQACAACHGANGEGNTSLNGPALAGQADWYLIRQINNFNQGVRGTDSKDSFGAMMKPMAMMLADDTVLANIAAYLASLPLVKHKSTLGGNPDKGKAMFGTCGACHGVNAEGNQAMNGPRLNAQQDWYLARQLRNFKAGIRGSHPKDLLGAQMRPMAMMLADDQAITDVVAHIGTLAK